MLAPAALAPYRKDRSSLEILASAPPKDAVTSVEPPKPAEAAPEPAAAETGEAAKKGDRLALREKPAEALPEPAGTAKPKEAAADPTQIIKPKRIAAKPRAKKLADATTLVQKLVHALVPRPPANIPGANAAKPR